MALTLLSLRDGEATVQLAEALTAPDRNADAPKRSVASLTLSPMMVGWSVAAIAGCGLVGLLLSSGRTPPREMVDVAPSAPPAPPREVPVTPTVPEGIPEEPVVVPERPPAQVPMIVFDHAADPPISALTAIPAVPEAPVVVRPDPQAVLAQRLIRFEQTRPTPRRDLLAIVEDLIGRRIDHDATTLPEVAAKLSEPVTVSLADGTVADLVAQILAGTDLQLAITANAARLQRRTTTAADDQRSQVLVPR